VTSRERAEALLHKLEMSNGPYAQRLDAVERAIDAAVAEEREACAVICDIYANGLADPSYCAEDIRARGAK
jgi:hypothetical protein